MSALRIGSLFSGIGGLDLGLERAGVGSPAWFCDVEPFALSALARRWPGVPQLTDVREVTPAIAGPIDVLCGGFPCQDISVAGKGAGLEGERSGLFFEMMRIVCEFAPRFIVFENVAAIRSRGLDAVLAEIHAAGYDAAWSIFGADAVGAPHRRLRWWCVAWRRGEGIVPAMGATWGPVGTRGKPPKHGVMAGGRIAHGAAWATAQRRPAYPTPVASSRRCEGDVRLMRRAAEAGLPLADAQAMVSGGLERPQGKLGAWPTVRFSDGERGGRGELRSQVFFGRPRGGALPTPTKCGNHNRKGASATSGDGLAAVVKTWPTPVKWEGRQAAVSPGDLRRKAPGLRADAVRADVGHSGSIDDVVQAVRDSGLTLSADWVDVLMGFPVGWTAEGEPAGWPGWPVRPGEPQPEAEPSRTVKRGTQANRGKRISALGNAVVPQCAEVVGRKLLEIAGGVDDSQPFALALQ